MTDEEATWRALKGEAQVAPLRCRIFGIHRWTVWKNDETLDTSDRSGNGVYKVRAWRYCADCNQADSKLFTFKKG